MPDLTVTLVDHTQDDPQDPPDFRPLIMRRLEHIFADLLFSDSEPTVINMRWRTTSPVAGDQDLVLHFVQDVTSSYIAQQIPGKTIDKDDGGFTSTDDSGKRGSEFYKFVGGARFSAIGYAKVAAHEAMHNALNMGNAMHSQGGIAGKPPKLPVNGANRTAFQAAMSSIPDQLL